jgi:polynucleotide 5'-hydroxyl-kinase GRC3/NOL9
MPAPRRVRMIKGPARVMIRGRCRVLGADVSNSRVDVRAGKALPFEPGRGTMIHALLGYRARMWWADPFSAGSLIWKDISREILSAAGRRRMLTVMIVGASDTGKSSLCTYLANRALSNGITPCIVDGDIGQGDIAPPSAIGAAALDKQVTDLRDATARHFGFVGSISPSGIEHLVAKVLQSLSKRTRESAPLQIINTDGYAHDQGIAYKRMIADLVQPDIVAVLGRNQPLIGALKSSSWQLLPVRSSQQATKSPSERRWRRQDQFLRFVGDGLASAAFDQSKFYYLGTRINASQLTGIPLSDNLFVGLGSDGNVLGFGVTEAISDNEIVIRTDLHTFDEIHLSNIRLAGEAAEQITLQMPGQTSQGI